MAPHVRGTVGIEVVTGAVDDAKNNALRNNVGNASFLAGKAEKVKKIITNKILSATCCIFLFFYKGYGFLSINDVEYTFYEDKFT